MPVRQAEGRSCGALQDILRHLRFILSAMGSYQKEFLARCDNLPFGFLKAHYGGRIQNGSEEAIWWEETSEEPVDSWELGPALRQGRWQERHCLERDLIIRIVRMWWWTGGEACRRGCQEWPTVCIMGVDGGAMTEGKGRFWGEGTTVLARWVDRDSEIPIQSSGRLEFELKIKAGESAWV